MLHLDVGLLPEDFGREIRGAGDARRREVEVPRLLLGARDEVGERVAREIGRHDRDQRHRSHPRDTGEVLHRVELDRLVDGACDGVAVGRQHQRVAVGRALGDRGGSRQTRPVLDDDLLLPQVGELVGEDAGEPVGDAAGGERNHDAHDLVGVGLRRGAGDSGCQGSQHPRKGERNHAQHHSPPTCAGLERSAGRCSGPAVLARISGPPYMGRNASLQLLQSD